METPIMKFSTKEMLWFNRTHSKMLSRIICAFIQIEGTNGPRNYFPFKNAGFIVKEVNVCKSCKKPAVSSCCPAHNARNRRKVTMIWNMKINAKGCNINCPEEDGSDAQIV